LPIFSYTCPAGHETEKIEHLHANLPEVAECSTCGEPAKHNPYPGGTGVAFGLGFAAQNYASRADRDAWCKPKNRKEQLIRNW
jgi:hypothetical protein